jgi:hypothetical protein
MKNIAYIFVVVVLELFIGSQVRADSTASQEYQVKAAFLYNFMKFVEWPAEKMGDANEPVIVGLIGSKDFIKAFEPIIQKKIHNKNITLKYFDGYEKLQKPQDADRGQWNQKIEALKSCHLLMFCSVDSVRLEATGKIIKALRDSPVLTVGQEDNFLESGGVINFLIEDKKVCFEINNVAAKRGKLKISSQLLRLGKRVIEEDGAKGAKD